MTKSELVQLLVKKNPHLLQRDIDKVVTTVFEEITNAMARGQRVELRGFGVFSVKHREPRTGRNPRTGQSVSVAPKAIPFFKIGKTLHMLINGETPPVGKPRGRKKASAA